MVVGGMERQVQALEALLMSDKFWPLTESVQEAIICAAGISPSRLRIGATGAWVMVTVVVPLATVATASVVWVVVLISMKVLKAH